MELPSIVKGTWQFLNCDIFIDITSYCSMKFIIYRRFITNEISKNTDTTIYIKTIGAL